MDENTLKHSCPSEISSEELLKMREGMAAEQVALLMAQITVPFLQKQLHMAMAMAVAAAAQIAFQQHGMNDEDIGIAQMQSKMLAEAAGMCGTLQETLDAISSGNCTAFEAKETAHAEMDDLLSRRDRLQEASAVYEEAKRELLRKHFEAISSPDDNEEVKVVAKELAKSLTGTGVCGPAKGNA